MKRFIAILLILVIAFSCVACSRIPMEKRFVKIDEYKSPSGQYVSLVFDPKTKVEYFLFGGSMCPRYDENGNITFYGGN